MNDPLQNVSALDEDVRIKPRSESKPVEEDSGSKKIVVEENDNFNLLVGHVHLNLRKFTWTTLLAWHVRRKLSEKLSFVYAAPGCKCMLYCKNGTNLCGRSDFESHFKSNSSKVWDDIRNAFHFSRKGIVTNTFG